MKSAQSHVVCFVPVLRRFVLLPLLLLLCCVAVVAAARAATETKTYSQPSSAVPSGLVVTEIEVSGNQRIEKSTILSYLGLREGSHYGRYDFDEAIKSLFSTGFFADIKLYPIPLEAGLTKLRVEVVENPIINRIAFEGNRGIEDDDLAAEIELKPRSVYTRTRVQDSVRRLLDIYRRSGRYSSTIEPKVIQLDQNRVDLVFEIEEGTVAHIANISFIGNRVFSTDTLTDVIRTERTAWYKFLSSDDKYDPDRLEFDKELLRRFYVSQGYADFQVKSAVAELSPQRDAFYITFTLDEGEKYNFGKIDISSKISGIDSEQLRENITTVSGETYNAEEIENTIDNIVKLLGDRGYAFVEVKPGFKRDRDALIIDLNYQVSQGPRVYVERINIFGNVRTLDEVIRREFRLAEGDPYSTSKLSRSEQRINNLGFFEKVRVTTEPGSAPDRTVINVEVEERSTGEISLGAGFSTADGPLADIGIKESNLLGRGQELRLRALMASQRQQFDIGFTEPYFLDRELAAGFDLFKTQQDLRTESSFDRETTGGSLRMGYAISEHLRHNLNYTLQRISVSDVASSASRFIRDQEGSQTTSSVGHSLIYDRRDNRFEPSSGYYLRFNQDIAGLGGDTHYIRNEGKAAYYYSFIPQWTVEVSGTTGHILGFGEDIRINDRFFIGSRQLRGFDRAGIGPRDTTTRDALGGNIYYTATTELRFPLGLPEELGFRGAVFADAGNLWDVDDSGSEVADIDTIRASLGVGVSWASPFGPIRLDFAKAILKEDIDETQVLHFSFGTRF